MSHIRSNISTSREKWRCNHALEQAWEVQRLNLAQNLKEATLAPLICSFAFLFQLPMVNCGPKIANGKSQKEFVSSKLCTILGSTMKSHLLSQHGGPSFDQHLHTICTAHRALRSPLWDPLGCHCVTVLVFNWPWCYKSDGIWPSSGLSHSLHLRGHQRTMTASARFWWIKRETRSSKYNVLPKDVGVKVLPLPRIHEHHHHLLLNPTLDTFKARWSRTTINRWSFFWHMVRSPVEA